MKQFALMFLLLFTFGFLTAPLYPSPAGQDVDLVKLKKEEEKRKKKLKKSKYVVTNDSLKNLDKVKGKGVLSKSGSKTKTGEKEKTQPNTPLIIPEDEQAKERDEKCKYWQKQKSNLIYDIYKTKADIKDLILEHNNIVKEFGVSTGDNQIKMMQRADAISKEIENKKKLILVLEEKIVDLEDNARKDGVLPGCLREIEYPPSKR